MKAPRRITPSHRDHTARAVRRALGRARVLLAAALGPVLTAWSSVVPVVFTVSAAAAVTVAGAAAGAAPAQAASGSVLILSTSVTGGTSSAEAAAVPSGYTVTVATPATWDAMTTAQFAAYSAIIIGDPSSTACASTVPSDALSTAATWGAAITGNVSVLGTAPAFAGTAGTALLKDAIGYAVAGSKTGLYVSLNCDYSSSTGSAVPLLAHVDGGGFTVTGQGSACPDTGRVNTWEAAALAPFNGLASSTWAAPACSVQETFLTWPAALSGVAYLNGASPADFTASDGQSGQPYVLAGAPASTATQALAPSDGGEVPAGATTGGSNAAAPAVTQATAGDPVNTENGDFTQTDTGASLPTFGPSLAFTKTYDAQAAQQQTTTKSPGPLGYGWTDNWASVLTTSRTTPGDIYTIGGLGTNTGQGGPATSAAVNEPGAVYTTGGDVYYADTLGSRIEEGPGTSRTQWGIAMTAGDVYTVAGSDTGKLGASASGTTAAASLLDRPAGVTLDSAGDLIIADTGNCRVLEVPAATTSTEWGGEDGTMTLNHIYVIAGRTGECALGNDAKTSITSDLNDPMGVRFGGSDLYIADSASNRIQEIAGAAGESEWGMGTLTDGDVYTVAGSAAGSSGNTGDGAVATSALLASPEGVTISGSGDMYIADTSNCRVQEVPNETGAQWGMSASFTKFDIYTVAGRTGTGTSTCALGTDAKASTSSDLDFPSEVTYNSSFGLFITDTSSNRVQEIARVAGTQYGQAMVVGDVYTVAGSSAGTSGYSGDGALSTSALFSGPGGVVADGSGDVFIADTFNNEIRELSVSTADISDVAGGVGAFTQEGNGGPAIGAGLGNPFGITSDPAGDVFVADQSSNRVQEIAASSHTQFGIAMTAGGVYTVAGSAAGRSGTSGDGGLATHALFLLPTSVALDPSGNLYIADSFNNRIQ
jgi:hypothetical protein